MLRYPTVLAVACLELSPKVSVLPLHSLELV
jgi:hypothetical protein